MYYIQHVTASLLKCVFSYSCAAFEKLLITRSATVCRVIRLASLIEHCLVMDRRTLTHTQTHTQTDTRL